MKCAMDYNEAVQHLMAQRRNTCRHFNGAPLGNAPKDKVCEAGVCYYKLVGGPEQGWVVRLPCIAREFISAADPDLCDFREPWPEDALQTWVEATVTRIRTKLDRAFAAYEQEREG